MENNEATVLGDRQPGSRENRKEQAACQAYFQLGAGRSLEALLACFQSMPHPPTRSARTLKAWSANNLWDLRARYYDETQQIEAERVEKLRLQGNLQAGLAQPGERVEALKRLYAALDEYLQLAWLLWKADLRACQNEAPDGAEGGRAPRFSPGVIAQMRGILEDLARETGGRALRGGLQLEVVEDDTRPDFAQLTREELLALNAMLQRITPSKKTGKPGDWVEYPSQAALPGLEPPSTR
jgi:hypothetical protein